MTMSNGLYYALYFVVTSVCYALIFTILRKISKYNPSNNLKTISIYFTSITLIYIFDIANFLIIKNIIIIIIFIITIKITSELSIKESLICFLKIFVIILIEEFITGLLFGYVISIPIDDKSTLLITKTIGLPITVLLYLIYSIIDKRKLQIKIDISWIFIICILILLVTIGTLNFVSTYNKNYNTYLLFIILILFMLLGFRRLIILIVDNSKKNSEISNLKNKNKEVIKYIDEFKAYKHNLRYNLLAIKEYGNKKVNKKIDYLLNKNNNELEYINNFKEIPSSLIHIFSDRLSIININNRNVIIRNTLKDKELIIKEKDYLKVCEIVGNCLTNSIEALPKENGVMIISFYENNNYQVVSIVNSFENSIDFEKIGSNYYSTKNRGSGFGLNTIFNSKVKVEAKVINNLFDIIIYIPKQKVD